MVCLFADAGNDLLPDACGYTQSDTIQQLAGAGLAHTAWDRLGHETIGRFWMSYRDAAGSRDSEISADEPLGPLVFHTALPGAIRSLDDTELRILLIALLQEWRYRGERMRE